MKILDRAIGFVAPHAGLRRARQRAAIALLARAYEGARLGRRTDGWVVAGTGGNAEIGSALVRLRDRSRDLVRNNPYAAKAVQAVVSNLVGTGIMPRARANDAALNEVADRLWARFAETCDAFTWRVFKRTASRPDRPWLSPLMMVGADPRGPRLISPSLSRDSHPTRIPLGHAEMPIASARDGSAISG